jgi:hypothetical protein
VSGGARQGGDAGGGRSQAWVSYRDLPREASRFHPAVLAVEVAAADMFACMAQVLKIPYPCLCDVC